MGRMDAVDHGQCRNHIGFGGGEGFGLRAVMGFGLFLAHDLTGDISVTARPSPDWQKLDPWYTQVMDETQSRKGSDTRERILDAAESSVIDNGFGATSIDGMIATVRITKSGLFYHFKDKAEMAKALLEKYLAREEVLFDELFVRTVFLGASGE